MVYDKDGSFSYGSKLPANLITAILNLRKLREEGNAVTTTAVMVDCEGLANGKLVGVFVGGFGADTNAPTAFQRTWAKSDLVGGVYYHPRIPSVYIRDTFRREMSGLDIVQTLRQKTVECECDSVYADDPAFMLWSLLQIFG